MKMTAIRMKIELSQDEIRVIEQNLKGEFGIWNATDYQKEHLSKVIDKAEALERELNAIDEVMEEEDCDLIRWFYKKWQAQQKEEG